jgi:pimeloyl-ACP methyl ester carboxylesterase
VATAIIDGIQTRYQIRGDGPPLLLFSPGGFDATIEKWSNLGIYAKTKPLDVLASHYTYIAFDRRECGASGGRIERIAWLDYVAQGKGLLDHLGIKRAHLMGGCLGCSPVLAFGIAYPNYVASMILYWPVGGARYRISSRQRFTDHLAYASASGLQAVVELAQSSTKAFGADPRVGPWASVIRTDPQFAKDYAAFDLNAYKLIVTGMGRTLFDRDTAPGAEPEDLLRCSIPALIIPGNDNSHATSAARYLGECLPASDYWDIAVEAQTQNATSDRLLEFLARHR